MYSIKTIICLLICLSLFACSTTEKSNEMHYSSNGYSKGYIGENYSRTTFTPVNQNTVKKALNSDHELMLSLINRPMTEDQAMMLNFAQQRAQYSSSYANHGVSIRGPKDSSDNTRNVHLYAHLIDKDINAVTITAPPQ